MSELETRESQFASVMDRGESLIISHHPASQVIEAHMLAMQDKWAWLLQLSLCMETHLKHTGTSQRFFSECSVAEEFLTQKEEILNNHFSQAEFKLEEGEELLKKPEDRLLGLLLLLGLLSLLVPIISLESLLSLELKLLIRDLLLDCDFEKLDWLELKSSDLKLELELVDTPDELDLTSLVALEDDVGVKPL